ncbi:keratin, type II cytoskeletal 2 epidermal-like [Zootermopsis nevadensis]|uniref:keratin, type II cytoskeletal 2 epidermal-like n=2 Tax=Zootermopsis nevadensis TaxID=136037 RepID=UPI000B8E8ABC|nr:keratin, type II cytoskeletal 2 epidermal-like [Zootermopsis nevadensis]
MKKNTVVVGILALATVQAASIPSSNKEAPLQVPPGPASDIAEHTEVEKRPHDAEININDATISDVVRSKRQFGGFGFGGSGSQAAANSYGGGYGGGGYPGGFGGSAFGSPAGYLGGGGGGFGGIGPYGGMGLGFSGSSAQSSSSAFGAGGGLWG